MLEKPTWQGTIELQPRASKVLIITFQQTLRNCILPATVWMSTGVGPSPVKPPDENVADILIAALKQRIQVGLAWISDPQKPWHNKYVFFTTKFWNIHYTAIDNYGTPQLLKPWGKMLHVWEGRHHIGRQCPWQHPWGHCLHAQRLSRIFICWNGIIGPE